MILLRNQTISSGSIDDHSEEEGEKRNFDFWNPDQPYGGGDFVERNFINSSQNHLKTKVNLKRSLRLGDGFQNLFSSKSTTRCKGLL